MMTNHKITVAIVQEFNTPRGVVARDARIDVFADDPEPA